MRRFRYIFYIVYNFLRLFFLKMFSGFKFRSHNIQLISPSSSIELGNNGKIIINGRLHTEPRVYISARDGGSLKIKGKVFVNRNSLIVCRDSIMINDGVTIGPNVVIYDHDHDIRNPGKLTTGSIVISEGAWIGAGAIILKGVHIGKRSVVAAGSIVTKSIPDNSVYYNEIIPRLRNIEQ